MQLISDKYTIKSVKANNSHSKDGIILLIYYIMSVEQNKVGERLGKVFDALGVNPNEIARLLDERPDKYYHVLKGMKKPAWDTLQELIALYPNINTEFLTKGIGQPLLDKKSEGYHPIVPFIQVPFVSVKVHGSFVENFGDMLNHPYETYPVFGITHEQAMGCYVVEVQGNSMAPRIRSGMKLLIKSMDSGDWIFITGVYAFVFGDHFVIKRVVRNDLVSTGLLELISDNPEGGSLTVRGEDIRGVWKVVKYVDGDVE